jgi:hypothetical protein
MKPPGIRSTAAWALRIAIAAVMIPVGVALGAGGLAQHLFRGGRFGRARRRDGGER